MTLDKFNESHRRLSVEGATADAPGRIHHSCFGDNGSLMVFQVWDSLDSFQKFGETLMPILAELGIDHGVPDVMVLHRLEQTTASQTN
jgi:hypothetical protein